MGMKGLLEEFKTISDLVKRIEVLEDVKAVSENSINMLKQDNDMIDSTLNYQNPSYASMIKSKEVETLVS